MGQHGMWGWCWCWWQVHRLRFSQSGLGQFNSVCRPDLGKLTTFQAMCIPTKLQPLCPNLCSMVVVEAQSNWSAH